MTLTTFKPTGFDAAGRSAVGFAPALTVTAPTLVELNAGVGLSCVIGGFEPTGDVTTRSVRRYCEKQASEVKGTKTFTIPPMRMLADPQKTSTGTDYDFENTLVEDVTGYLWERRGPDAEDPLEAGQLIDIYPVQLALITRVPLDLNDDGGQKFENEYRFLVTGPVLYDVAIAGA